MEKEHLHLVQELSKQYLKQTPASIQPLGGGFYGRVYGVSLKKPPFQAAFKLYLFPDFHRREAAQLDVLDRHALLKVPQVYFVHDQNESLPIDALCMEYLDGVNAGLTKSFSAKDRAYIADQIVENLLAWHDTIHPEGFGEILDNAFSPDWNSHYKANAGQILSGAKQLLERQWITPRIYTIAERAYSCFDDIFSIPADRPRLLHGDYNNYNILLNKEATRAFGVIDPFLCCWGDSELDLYQLDNANGKEFGLLALYRKKRALSSNFDIKRAFYELFTELMHFHMANVNPEGFPLPQEAEKLALELEKRHLA